MESAVFKYIYLDFLVDPRVPKKFSDQSSATKVLEALSGYFDQALDRKGFNYKKLDNNGSFQHRKPDRYQAIRSEILDEISKELLRDDLVFAFENHPLFGRKCQVDSEKFVELIKLLKSSVSISEGSNLDGDMRRWGVSRFRDGLSKIYTEVGGFFDPQKWVDFDLLLEDGEGDVVKIPDLEEIIQIDKETPQVVEISKQANELVRQLQTGNDLGEFTPEEASAAITEVRQIITAFEGSRVRAHQLHEFSKKTLLWIASKGGEALIGILATSLLALIAAYFGFSI